jgi:hypothetical protein
MMEIGDPGKEAEINHIRNPEAHFGDNYASFLN